MATSEVVDMEAAKECAPELYAYFKVETFGRQLGEDADVVADAVDALGAQLEDCLDHVGAGDVPLDDGPSSKKAASLPGVLTGI
ncbi:hypothetical protein DOU54_13640 [Agrobacterium sp. MS2]|jgi:hypothetical protein|nr:hypothetical protein DOU54_13640 [Agrobacterium sp. MS2]